MPLQHFLHPFKKAFAVYIICLVVIPTNCVTYSLPRFSRGFFEVNNERRTIAGSPNEDETGNGNRTNEAALILQGILARINRLKKLKEEEEFQQYPPIDPTAKPIPTFTSSDIGPKPPLLMMFG